ncbi:TetR family transcriptional regulator [Mycolicibacterium thermoresistibile]
MTQSPEHDTSSPEAGTLAPGTPRRRPRIRPEEIVSAAAEFFAREGYANVGMRDVAEALGIRGASLYHHFSSKEEILYAICLTVTKEPNELNLPLLDAAGTPAQRLSALIGAHLEHLIRRRVEHLVALHDISSLTPEHRATIDDLRRYYQRRVRDVIVAGVRSGEFQVPDPQLAALLILDALNGVSGWFNPDRGHTLPNVISAYTEMIVERILSARIPS